MTAHCELEKALSQAELYNLYQKFYLNHRFVRLRENIPEINDVVASNFCDISLTVRGKDLVCFAVLDNLVKGMAGQSIQNMNLMFGLNEATGLLAPALSIN